MQSDAMIEWGLDLDSQTKEVVPFGLEKSTSVFFPTQFGHFQQN